MESLQIFNSKQIRLVDRPCSHYVSVMGKKEAREVNGQVWKLTFTPSDFKCLKNRDLVLSMTANEMPYICSIELK